MSSIDIIFIAFLAFFAFIGLWKGFFREVLGLAGVVGGVFFGIVFFGPMSKILSRALPGIPAVVWPFLSFLVIFIAVYFSSRLLAGMLSKLSKAIYLGWLNRLFGGAVGALKGAILISIILLLIGFLPFQQALQDVRQQSALYEPLQRLVPIIYNYSTGLSDSSKNFEKKILRTLEGAKVKLSEEMIKYYFYGKKNSPNKQ
ncbi:MAG TPA: CvpA family protein [Caldithrix sp.]|nr:CvpA family protein [Caldithrix sp.]